MLSKPFKVIGYVIFGAVIVLFGYIVIGALFFSYNKKTLIDGCEHEFCVGQTKSEVHALFEGKYSFEHGAMVPYDPRIKPSEFIYSNTPNSIDELIVTDK